MKTLRNNAKTKKQNQKVSFLYGNSRKKPISDIKYNTFKTTKRLFQHRSDRKNSRLLKKKVSRDLQNACRNEDLKKMINIINSTKPMNILNLNTGDSHGNTCLHIACKKNNVEMVKLLLEFGKQNDFVKKFDIHKTNVDEETPLSLTTNQEIIDLLNNAEP